MNSNELIVRFSTFLCKLGFHNWVRGFDTDVDIFGFYKRCKNCGIERAGK